MALTVGHPCNDILLFEGAINGKGFSQPKGSTCSQEVATCAAVNQARPRSGKSIPVIDDFWGTTGDTYRNATHTVRTHCRCLQTCPDYLNVVADALTEGFNNKDVNLCLVDREAGQIYIAKCYIADSWDKFAPAIRPMTFLPACLGFCDPRSAMYLTR